MTNIINFIKKNFSVFNFISFLLLFFLIIPNNSENGCARGWVFFGKILSLVFVIIMTLIDIIMKKVIKNRLKLNIIQGILILFLIIYIYNL